MMSSDDQTDDEFERTWRELKDNLFDIHSEFDPFQWISRLVFALLRRTPLYFFKGHIVQFLPLVAIGAVFFVLWAYYSSLHSLIMLHNFPACSKNITCFCVFCNTLLKIAPLYIGVMIIFNFLCTVFSSPGTCNDPYPRKSWRATQGQGGMCYLNPTSFHHEACLKQWSQQPHQVISNDNSSNHTIDGKMTMQPMVLLPSPNGSFCIKCKIQRPPRCHHCSKCNRCILQMDHHCYWVNNCIGFNNYRTFLLTIIYLVIGCWYGLILCAVPFRTAMKQSPSKEVLYNWKHFRQSIVSMDRNDLLKVVVFVLIFAGLFLTILLCSHLYYISIGVTTVERKQMVGLKTSFSENTNGCTTTSKNDVQNCFDQGIRKNFIQVFGENAIFMALLPIRVSPPSPYLPYASITKKDI